MTYALNFIGKSGLWELQVNRFRIRFYRTRDEAMKCVTRYRRMLQAEQDRYEGVRWNALSPNEKVAEFERLRIDEHRACPQIRRIAHLRCVRTFTRMDGKVAGIRLYSRSESLPLLR